MKRLALLALLALAPDTPAQCRTYRVVQSAPSYEWRDLASDPGRKHLFRNGVQIGAFDTEKGYYRPFDAATNTWGERCGVDLVGRVLAQTPAEKGPAFPTGVEWERIAGESFRLNGEEVGRAKWIQALDATIPDWSARLHLTVISADAELRKRIVADVAKSPLAPRVLVKEYDPAEIKEAWALDPGFAKTGTQIYLQDRTGKVLRRETSYQGEETLSALRKADPNYKPELDPNTEAERRAALAKKAATTPLLAEMPEVPWSAPLAAGGILAAAGFSFFPRRKVVLS